MCLFVAVGIFVGFGMVDIAFAEGGAEVAVVGCNKVVGFVGSNYLYFVVYIEVVFVKELRKVSEKVKMCNLRKLNMVLI